MAGRVQRRLPARAAQIPGPAPTKEAIGTAVDLLRLAISDQACELVRPSEWIGIDPDLHGLRQNPKGNPDPRLDGEFEKFVRAQAARDFAPAKNNNVGDPWFREYLPRTAPSKASPPPPGGGSPSNAGPRLPVPHPAGPSDNMQLSGASAGQHNETTGYNGR